MTSNPKSLDDSMLLEHVRALVLRCNQTEADLIEHLAELDARRLYLPDHTSMFAFCTAELGFSEAAAENRIAVARAGRRFGRIFAMLRSGAIHLSGLRVLVPHLTDETADVLLAQSAGKSKRAIEQLVADHAPKPDVAESIRKLPQRRVEPSVPALMTVAPPRATPALLPSAAILPKPATAKPLAPERYHVQLTASRELRDKIEEAKALLRHQVPTGDLATILERALGLLIAQVKKDRFGVGRKARRAALPEGPATSRHIPDAIKRTVFERDEGRCTFVGTNGQRCEQRGWLELDHLDGFARRAEHRVSSLTLRCRAHNQYAAELMYGAEWMARKRQGAVESDPPRGDLAEGSVPRGSRYASAPKNRGHHPEREACPSKRG